MPLIKNGRITEDRYIKILDDAPLPEDVPVIVPAERFLADAEEILRCDTPVGIIWPNNRKVAELVPYLDRLALVVLVFPVFKDGRAYSQARLLRERYDFRGELRATGQILRDQFLFQVRAGFDTFEVTKASDVDAFAAALTRYSVFYQTAGERRISVARRRAVRLAAAVPGEAVVS
ncbi:MAG TPA: DUF934 domain-containing protein [Xanthobacteraceae bacterium]|nr:DUF934 domain-containing protein [Xanthobacteraceae bacterium]